ncbi:MAG: sigma 54-interacting transcriptional regulator, partial [Pirellula staleyi]
MEEVNPADQPNRSIAKRQIARLLGGSSCPMYVLSEDDTLVFANEAIGAFVGRSAEGLLGLDCSSPIPKDDASDSRLKAFLSLPIAWSRRHTKIVPFVNPFQNASIATPLEATRENNSETVRCLIPLENTGAGCTLCILCDMDGADSLRRSDEHAAIVQHMVMESRNRYAHLNELWFLQGKSALTRRALEQTQLAIANSYPITILGANGSGKTWLAQAIHAHRFNPFNAAQFDGNSALIRIECGLMDADLLQSMLELIHESIKDESKHPAI